MDDVLYSPPKEVEVLAPNVDIARNDNSLQAKNIGRYKVESISFWVFSWKTYFDEWQKNQEKQFLLLAEQNRLLYEQNLQLQEKLEYLVARELHREWLEEQEKNKKLKGLNAKKKPKRDIVIPADFSKILEIAYQSHTKKCYSTSSWWNCFNYTLFIVQV